MKKLTKEIKERFIREISEDLEKFKKDGKVSEKNYKILNNLLINKTAYFFHNFYKVCFKYLHNDGDDKVTATLSLTEHQLEKGKLMRDCLA